MSRSPERGIFFIPSDSASTPTATCHPRTSSCRTLGILRRCHRPDVRGHRLRGPTTGSAHDIADSGQHGRPRALHECARAPGGRSLRGATAAGTRQRRSDRSPVKGQRWQSLVLPAAGRDGVLFGCSAGLPREVGDYCPTTTTTRKRFDGSGPTARTRSLRHRPVRQAGSPDRRREGVADRRGSEPRRGKGRQGPRPRRRHGSRSRRHDPGLRDRRLPGHGCGGWCRHLDRSARRELPGV